LVSTKIIIRLFISKKGFSISGSLKQVVGAVSMIGIFSPILAGATLRERLLACLGSLIGIGLTGLLCKLMLGGGGSVLPLVAPVGASAVLLFAVPASPLAQPWPIVGGNALSALVGILVGSAVADPVLAAGLAVALAILVMSLTRSLHPPGGAMALSAALGGPAVAKWGLLFPLVPVGLNCFILVCLGLLFHQFRGHSYPHIPPAKPANTHGTSDLPPARRVGIHSEDVDAALAKLNETFDINRDDLEGLISEIESRAMTRAHADMLCRDIMSRDVVSIGPDATRDQARALLIRHNVRLLPVIDRAGRLLGTVGLRELASSGADLASLLSPARTASPESLALELLPALTDGTSHAIIVTDEQTRVAGIISQTDLLGALSRRIISER
jgi:CBS domain-containing membrane protein